MATSLADLLIKMDVDSARFRKELKDVSSQITGLEKKAQQAGGTVQKAFDSMVDSAKALVGVTAIVGAAKGLFDFVKSTIDAADAMEELSQKTGVSVESLSKLQYAAKFSGVDIEGVAIGLKKLAKTADEAAGGGKEQAEAFKRIGVSVKDANGQIKPLDTLLGDIAERFASYEDGASKSALAQEFFGKSGADLIPFLNEGKAGLKKLGDEAERLGIVLSPEMAKRSAEFNDTLDRLAASSKASGMAIADYMLPSLQKLATKFEEVGAAAALANAAASLLGSGASDAAAKAFNQAMASHNFRMTIDPEVSTGYRMDLEKMRAPSKPEDKKKAKTVKADDDYYIKFLKDQDATVERLTKHLLQLADAQEKAQIAKWQEENTRATQHYEEVQASIQRVMEDTETPLDTYIRQMEELNALQKQATLVGTPISADRMSKAQQKLNDQLSQGRTVATDYTKVLEGMQFTAEKAATGLADVLSEHIFDGFKRGLAGLAEDFAKVLFRMATQAAAAKIMGSLFNLGSIGAAALGGGVTGLTAATPNDAGNVLPLAELNAGGGGSSPVILNLSHRSLDMTVRDAIERELATSRATR